MKTFDISCFYGSWPTYPVKGALADIAAELQAHGITAGFISPLAAVWCRNQQAYNQELLAATRSYACFYPVPALDPTLPSWREEVEVMRRDPRVKAFRVFLNYTRFDLARRDSLNDFLDCFNQTGLPLIIQRRMEDSRYNHHHAVVPDTDIHHILHAALQFPTLKLILGGVSSGVNAAQALKHPGVYLDTSQMDGMGCIREKIGQGLLPRLLFGSHMPVFETSSAFGRVLHDVSDDEAGQILGGNAARIFMLD